MTAQTLTSSLEAQQIDTMNRAIADLEFHPHYLTRVANQPLTPNGLAFRVQAAFGNGELYDTRYTATDDLHLVFLADPSIPPHLVRQALQTVALDRIVAETINAESAMAAERHFQGQAGGLCPELRRIPRGCPVRDVQDAYVAIVRRLIKTPGYRDQIGDELTDVF